MVRTFILCLFMYVKNILEDIRCLKLYQYLWAHGDQRKQIIQTGSEQRNVMSQNFHFYELSLSASSSPHLPISHILPLFLLVFLSHFNLCSSTNQADTEHHHEARSPEGY